LADASSVAGDLHAVGLGDENVGSDGGAGGNVGARCTGPRLLASDLVHMNS
jgi:hypothetical protein